MKIKIKKFKCLTFSHVLSDSERFAGVERYRPIDGFRWSHYHLFRWLYPCGFWWALDHWFVVDPRRYVRHGYGCRHHAPGALRLRSRCDARFSSRRVSVHLRFRGHWNYHRPKLYLRCQYSHRAVLSHLAAHRARSRRLQNLL